MKLFNNCKNPVFPIDFHVPDGEAHVMPDGKVYIYGSWDNANEYYCSEEYRTFSSSNLIDWNYHGESFNIKQVPWSQDKVKPNYMEMDLSDPTPLMKKFIDDMKKFKKNNKDLELKNLLYAPDAIHYKGKYYLYFCMADQSEGVAISDNPEGPFENPVQLHCGGIDPAIFIDDDNQAYYYWGQFYGNVAKLKNSMTEINQDTVLTRIVSEQKHYFHEGSSMRKRGEIYYLIYTCIKRGKPTALGYSTSLSPLGPFTYQGIIIDNAKCDPKSWNNHGSIEEVNGQWYVFYHRSSRNSDKYRRLCIEPITFNEDGTINEVKMSSNGANTPFQPGDLVESYRACELSGDLFISPDKTLETEVLTGIKNSDTAVFRYFKLLKGEYEFKVDAEGSGTIEVTLDDSIEPIATLNISNGNPTMAKCKFPDGIYSITLKFINTDNLILHNFLINN